MKVSDYIVKFFEEKKIETIFGYLGGMITHLADSIAKNEKIDFIQVYHEQTASIAIEGYARENGNIGVAIATSGPGATNMITGIADAYFDSIPALYITGQVNSYEYKYDKPIRQLGFQETDVVSLVKGITKYSKMITDEKMIKYELEKAYFLAKDGRQGPVLLDIPMNIQRAEIDPDTLIDFIPEISKNDKFDFSEVNQILKSAKRPMLLLGGGCINSNAQELINEFQNLTGIPAVSSLMGKGAVDETKDEYMGMVGSYGNRCANIAVANADLLIALGSRLDTRQTGAMVEAFLKHGKIIHIDIDKNELEEHRIKNKINVHMDTKEFIQNLEKNRLDISEWKEYLKNLKQNYNQEKEIERNISNKSPYKLIQTLNKYSKEGEVFTGDIGQNQMWTAQSLILKKNQKFFTSGGLAPMGYSLPCSVGVAFAKKNDEAIYSINGDGGFHMAVQSLLLISQYNLPIKVVVMNNNALGMITQFQELYFENRLTGTVKDGGYILPDMENISKAYGLKYYKIGEGDLLNENLMKEIFSRRNCLIDYQIEGESRVYPKLEFNSPLEDTSPKLPKDELEKLMIKC
ncbi:MAG: thiamine pyrophosphate-binding protein [Cetobacterium sp.]